MAQWSEQIESAYQLQLPEDVRAWLDQEIWQQDLGAEFCAPLDPGQLLSPGQEEIWAGFMPPDVLPLIGNDYGDWLCLRVGRDSRVEEVIKWSHSGGDWHVMGRTLSEALMFDVALRLLRDRRPEFTDPEPPRQQLFGAAEWAASLANSHAAIEPFWRSGAPDDPVQMLRSLVDQQLAEFGALQELALLQLDCELKRRSGPQTARQLNVGWNPEFVRWLFDGQLVPEPARQQLAQQWGVEADELVRQDWDGAEQTASQVAARRNDLGWALDVAGWAAERRGQWDQAADCYLRGLEASVFGDDAIRFRTQWFPEGFGKFPAFRLHELAAQLDEPRRRQLEQNEYLQLLWANDSASLRERVTKFWQREATRRTDDGDAWQAYQCLVAAGWDIGMSHLSHYASLLADVAKAARDAGAAALARIAETHLRVF